MLKKDLEVMLGETKEQLNFYKKLDEQKRDILSKLLSIEKSTYEKISWEEICLSIGIIIGELSRYKETDKLEKDLNNALDRIDYLNRELKDDYESKNNM